MLRAARQDDLEDFLFARQFVEERAPGDRSLWLQQSKLAQRVVDDLSGRCHGGREAVRAEL